MRLFFSNSINSKLAGNFSFSFWWRLARVALLLLILGTFVSVQTAVAGTDADSGLAVPRFVPLPDVTLSTGSVMLGEDFTINATFTNNGDETGYGPFIDLYIPHVGSDGLYPDEPNYDGISPASGANYVASLGTETLTVVTQTFPDVDGAGPGTTGCVRHPWALNDVGFYLDVCGIAGDQLVSVQLPYGSYTPGQPSLTVSIPVHLSENANLGEALSIRARAGFIYGRTPMIDWCCTDPVDTTIVSDAGTPDAWAPFSDVIPTVVTFSKSTNAGELATGPNSPASYTLRVNLAEGQTFSNINITDNLPNSVVYLGGLSANPAPTTVSEPPLGGPYNGAQLLLHWDGPVSSDIIVTFNYYVPEFDADNQPVAPGSTTNTATLDTITWIPSDGSPPLDVSAGVGPGVANHTDRPITLGKGSTVVVDPGSNGATPGDIVRYTLTFNISDYFGFANISLEDVLSDGQHYFQNAIYFPELSLTRDGSTQSFAFSAGNVDIACNYTDTGFGGECDSHDYADSSLPENDGETTITFNIAQELIDQVGSNQVLGDLVNDGGGPANVTTTGAVTFYALVQDTYTDTYPGESLKMGDTLGDLATISGNQVDPATCNPGPCVITATVSGESASAGVRVGRGALEKTIVARNGAVCNPATFEPCASVQVAAGDTITYRITYELLTGDFANLSLTDFLPLPIFHADDPNVDGSSLATWAKYADIAVIPDPGTWMLGPGDTRGFDPNPVAIAGHLNDNSVKFEFGTYDDPLNLPKTIDLLFTVRVTNEKFGDGLQMRNSVVQQDANSPGSVSTTNNFIDLTLTEPILVGEKTVISTDHTSIEPNPPMVPPVVFELPGNTGVPWNSGMTPINSEYLDDNPLGSGIDGIDGGDLVKFAIVIENTGNGINGAYDITLKDILPDAYIFPGVGLGGFNLQAHRGDGRALDDGTGSGFEFLGPNGDATDFFENGIRLKDPAQNPAFAPSDPEYGQGLCQLHEAASGKNVIIVTYDLMVDPDIAPGAILQNEGQVTSYSGSEGGEPYIPEPITNISDSEIGNPSLLKELVGTEIDNSATADTNNKTQVVIGELATYRLTVTVPEGLSPNAQIVDTLDPELAFVSQVSSTNSNPGDVTLSGSFTPTITNNGRTITWDLGNIENNNTDNGVAETLIFEYKAVVLNISNNQSGSTRNNSVTMTWDTKDADGNTITGSIGPVASEDVTVIEPVLNIAKTVDQATADGGDPVEFTLTITHDAASETDAYDITLSDPLPLCAVGGPSAIHNPVISSVTDSAGLVSAANLELSGDNASGWRLGNPAGSSFDVPLDATRNIEIKVSGTLAYCVSPTRVLTNTSTLYWTSLDGDIVDRSTYNTADSDERTGADGVGGALDDYADAASATVTIDSAQLDKYLVNTSEAHTADTPSPVRLTIGEIVRYRLAVTVPEGQMTNFQLDDNLPGGLTYMDDGTARVAFISNGAGILSSDYQDVPAIPAGCTISGTSVADIGSALPCQLSDWNVDSTTGTTFTPDDTDNYATNTDPQFKLGTLQNTDSDPDAELVVVEFNALVDNNSGSSSNDIGEARNNNFTLNVNGTLPRTSGNVNGRIVEPVITNLSKTVSPNAGDAGDTVAYQVAFTNINGASTTNVATAFDAVFTDSVPGKLSNVTLTGLAFNPAACGVFGSDTSSGNDIRLTFTSLDAGCQVLIDYTAQLTAAVTPGESLVNNARVVYSSVPGNKGTAPNATGSTVEDDNPAVNSDESGGLQGERNGTGPNPPNDYFDTATAPVSVTQVSPVKSLVSSTNPLTLGNDLTIGETARFRMAVQLAEGTSPDFEITDNLPAGLQFLDDGSARLAFVSNGAGIASSILACANDVGSAADVTLPTVAVDCDLTGTISGSPFGDGADPVFTLGALTNSDADGDNEYVVLEFNARLVNALAYQSGGTSTNNFTVAINGVDRPASNDVTVNFVEPVLDIAKSADDSTWVYGQTVEYTLDIIHTVASNASAYDIVITDTIPVGLTYNNITSLPANWTSSYTAPTLTLACLASNGCSLPLGSSAQLTFTVIVDDLPRPPAGASLTGTDTAVNTASITWTSLDGAVMGERTGGGGVDDYSDTNSHTGGLDYYALGNRVWFDTDNNSLIDTGEVGVDGVTVRLYKEDGAGNFVDTGLSSITADGGYYLFDYLEAGNYIVALPQAENFSTGRVLEGYFSSGTSMAVDGSLRENPAPTPENNLDSDDNGTLQTGATFTGAVISQPVTLGPTGDPEPADDDDFRNGTSEDSEQPDARSNLSVDFGFYRASIGDQIYYDDNFNGTFDDGTDQPLGDVTVRLYVTDGITSTEIADTTSDAVNGQYLFSNLPQGNYIVSVEGPANTASTVDSSNAADTAIPDTNQDDNDNGIGTSGGVASYAVSSNTMPLRPGWAGNSNTVTNTTGETYNPTLDFGFVHLYNLGNRVWFDTDNNSGINGSEVGAVGVTVELYKFNTVTSSYDYISLDTTGIGGYYLFENLYPGNYVVSVAASNFTAGAVLEGYWSSATYINADGTTGETAAPSPEDNQDSDDNGVLQSGSVVSLPVTLGPVGATEPTDDDDLESGVNHGSQPDGRSDLTVDFGFYKTEIGNLVFGDVNKNGSYDAGTDTLLDAITVYLYAENNTTILATTTTTGGEYLFSGLPAGNYIIKVDAPAGTLSTRDDTDLDDNTITGPDANTDDNDNGQGIGSGLVTAGALNMTPGYDATKPNNVVDDGTGSQVDYGVTRNPTVDFGFTTVYALGNRVWFDTNNSRLIDNGEGVNLLGDKVGVDGVLLQLYVDDGTGSFIDTGRNATTANGGYYLFDNLESGSYQVIIPASNFASSGPLYGYWSSQTTRQSDSSLHETLADSPETNQDSDDNGTRQASGAIVSQTVVLGPGSVEPVNEPDTDALAPGTLHQGNQPDAQANMTVDFGFYAITLGDQIWNDSGAGANKNNGVLDGDETGIDGVTLEIYSANGAQIMLVGPDGIPGTADDVAAETSTSGGGFYTFTGLPQGDYILRIPATEFEGAETLRDFVSSTGQLPASYYEPAPSADIDTVDSDDNGSTIGGALGSGGYVQTEVVSLVPAGELSYDNDTGATAEPRVDFGVYVYRQVDTSITKNDGQSFYLRGDVLTYTIVVSNDGPSDLVGAQVSDPRPLSQITTWTWDCTNATGGATGCDEVTDSNADFIDVVDLPNNSSITYIVTANVDAAATGDLVNTATITVPAGVTEIDTTDTSSTDIDTFASLTVTKSDSVEVVAPGHVLTYNILIENSGNIDLNNVTVTDTLPDDVTLQSATVPPDSNSGNMLVWYGISIMAGGSYSIDVVVRVNDAPVNPAITNQVEAMDNVTGATSSDTDIDTIAVLNEKTIFRTNMNNDTNPQVLIGEVITYQISLTIPTGTLLGLQALDVLDGGLAFDECLSVSVSDPVVVTTSLPGGFADACPADAGDPDVTNSGHTVVFDFGDVTNASAIDQFILVQYTVDVLDIAANVDGVADINNSATWTWNGGSRGTTAPPVEILEPDLSIHKSASPSVALIGSTITFTVDLAHTSASSADAYDVVVTDRLPSGLTFVGNETNTGLPYDGFTYDPATSTITVEWAVFPLQATSSFTFEAAILVPPLVTNEASDAWTSIPLDPGVQSNYNIDSTERFYDPIDLAGVNDYGVSSSATINVPSLPKTGFAPGRVTHLPEQPKNREYIQMGSMILEVPRLGLNLPIVGVPANDQGWDLTWLSNQAGWLEGSAYPTWAGNTAITAHTYLADGTPGPFVNLNTLYWGDEVLIHANGQRYTYHVREVRLVWPKDLSVLRHEGYDWVTLITCRDYNEMDDDYTHRVAVRAVLVRVEPEP